MYRCQCQDQSVSIVVIESRRELALILSNRPRLLDYSYHIKAGIKTEETSPIGINGRNTTVVRLCSLIQGVVERQI